MGLGLVACSIALALSLSACSTDRQTSPLTSASEQLLVTSAAEKAARKLDLGLPVGMKVYVDASYFEGTHSRHAVGAIRANLLKQGLALVNFRDQATAIVELRAGALSIDESETLFGLRSFQVPVPLAGDITTPELALFKKTERKGVAKFAAAGYRVQDGRLLGISEPEASTSSDAYWVALLVVSWKTSDREEGDDLDFLDEW